MEAAVHVQQQPVRPGAAAKHPFTTSRALPASTAAKDGDSCAVDDDVAALADDLRATVLEKFDEACLAVGQAKTTRPKTAGADLRADSRRLPGQGVAGDDSSMDSGRPATASAHSPWRKAASLRPRPGPMHVPRKRKRVGTPLISANLRYLGKG